MNTKAEGSPGRAVRLSVRLTDRELYKKLQYASIERDMSLNGILVEAIRRWLEAYEDGRAAEAIHRAMEESGDDPGVPWDEFKAQLRKEKAAERARS